MILPFSMPEPSLIKTNGIELEVFQLGQGGTPIVLCHGWPELAYSWRYQIPALVKAGYHCIVPNQRGYGNSSKPNDVDAYDIIHLTNDQNGLLDALGIEKAIYVGHDWGSIMLWQHALINPKRIIGMANMSVPYSKRRPIDPIEFWELKLGEEHYIVHFNRQPNKAAISFEKNTKKVLTNIYRSNHWLKNNIDKFNDYSIIKSAEIDNKKGELILNEYDLDVFVNTFDKNGFIAPCNWYRNFSRNWKIMSNYREDFSMPCLMIYGKYDSVPKKNMDKIISNLETHTLDCGHWIQQEQPEKVNQILLNWLEKKIKPVL